MLWICNPCTSAYSVDAPRCPECGADDHIDEGTVLVEPAAVEPEVKLAKAKPAKDA